MATVARKFPIGATVSLNTGGGPVMSVKNNTSGYAKNEYVCQWFAGKKLDQGVFLEEQLVAAAPKEALPPPEEGMK